MRICRFILDELTLAGFYADDVVIPIDQAAESFSNDTGNELMPPTSGRLLELLPDGSAFEPMRILAEWVEMLDTERLAELTIPVSEVSLLVPIGYPRKLLLLAGNYAAHVIERGGTTAEREETFPYVFMKPATTLTHPGEPDRDPAGFARPHRLGVRARRRDRPDLSRSRRSRSPRVTSPGTPSSTISATVSSPPIRAENHASGISSSTGSTASGTTRFARSARVFFRRTPWMTRSRSWSS